MQSVPIRILLVASIVLALTSLAQESLVPVTRVVDGDTLWVERGGQLEKLRVLSVDTEEKISGRPTRSTTKPETVLGEETALWTRALLDGTAVDGVARVRLVFPSEGPRRDAFGRLLCHVELEDGRNLGLLLVRRGLSPYFVKYGRDTLLHDDFVRAQAAARAEGLGIWSRDAPTGAAHRRYDVLLPWWEARAEAVEAFRRRRAADDDVVAAEDPEQLALALERCSTDDSLRMDAFGEIERFYEEDDGALTVRFASVDPRRALRVVIPADSRDAELEGRLERASHELAQNYLFVRGRVRRGARGFRMVVTASDAWRNAGPAVLSPAGTTQGHEHDD